LSSVVEEAIKILVNFEAELDKIKEQVMEAKKDLMRTSSEEGEKARKEVLARVQVIAEENIRRAREEAEREAKSILFKGEESLKVLREKISRRNKDAIELVVKYLMSH
jgi:vacuolar-type H+-ATPase subunit H